MAAATSTWTWDFENRLLQTVSPNDTPSTVNYKYDPFGRRIQKVSSHGTTIYVYDGDNIIEELDSNGNSVARYAQGLGIDEPLAMLRSSVTSFYQADGLGSITSLSDTTGALAATYTYDSFGKKLTATGTITNPYRFTGRELDTETGQYYNRARYYMPFMGGRFVNEDPARHDAGIDFYTYVGNSPTNLIDPSGFCPWEVHRRPIYWTGPVGRFLELDHYYFYNVQTHQSIGLAPTKPTLRGPAPGKWETSEKPGENFSAVPDDLCGCVDKKAKNPGNPPEYCTFKGQLQPIGACTNCIGWVQRVVKDCIDQNRPSVQK